ncbi:hypothetical protein P3W85_39490 [Cupriavidus basilensis]|uniref:Branched-chain amino acid ABC transporter permease n=1 Tax=Cupriavidus basilensis TaxID=68895 RepID=A0ABT6B2Y6_9BURK|nr:hypothetical protein [Cupriavidus basilensis]MDF3838978.1 hypothetical protein [Cupriavidus basilensis]
MGLNVLVGINGQLSLGHGVFYALGAYTVAILMDRYGMPYGWSLPANICSRCFGPRIAVQGPVRRQGAQCPCMSTTTCAKWPASPERHSPEHRNRSHAKRPHSRQDRAAARVPGLHAHPAGRGHPVAPPARP